MTSFDYDVICIGGGSGGIACAKRSASYGKRVLCIERARLGGTCVNVGCVPKKVMWSAAHIAHTLKHDMEHYGFSSGGEVTLDFPKLKQARDKYVKRLNGIYAGGFERAGVDSVFGDASFVDEHTVKVTDKDGNVTNYQAEKIVIATGGRPNFPPGDGIEENCISSDGFFELEDLPKVAVVVGAGYIAVELAGVLNSLGSETHLVVRKERALREFDPMVSEALDKEMVKAGIFIHRNTNGVAKITSDGADKKNVFLQRSPVGECFVEFVNCAAAAEDFMGKAKCLKDFHGCVSEACRIPECWDAHKQCRTEAKGFVDYFWCNVHYMKCMHQHRHERCHPKSA